MTSPLRVMGTPPSKFTGAFANGFSSGPSTTPVSTPPVKPSSGSRMVEPVGGGKLPFSICAYAHRENISTTKPTRNLRRSKGRMEHLRWDFPEGKTVILSPSQWERQVVGRYNPRLKENATKTFVITYGHSTRSLKG